MMKTFEEASKKLKGKMLFSFSDIKEGVQERLGDFMGVTIDQIPLIKALLPSKEMQKYSYD